MKYRKEKIIGYEDYQVDTNGIVYGKNGKPLKYALNHKGYCIVNFYINNKRTGHSIHRLVAKQFISNNDRTKTQVNHIDGNKENNCVDNLEWVTPKENTKHSIEILGNNKIGSNSPMAKQIIGIDVKTNKIKYSFLSLSDAARYFNDDNKNYRYKVNSISRVINGKRKTYKGCYWKFK